MTTTSAQANSGSKTKTKAKTNSGSKAKARGERPKARGGKPADGKTSRQRAGDAVADRIIELLDQGQLPPWEKDWRDSTNGTPRNAVSMKPYRGVNRWMTLLTHMIMGYQDPRWLTYRQAEALGGHVRKGERSTEIVFWKRVPVRDREDGGGNGPQGDGQQPPPSTRPGRSADPAPRPPTAQPRSESGPIPPRPPPGSPQPPQLPTTPAPNCPSSRPNRPPPGPPLSSDSRIVLTSPSPLPHLSLNWAKWAF